MVRPLESTRLRWRGVIMGATMTVAALLCMGLSKPAVAQNFFLGSTVIAPSPNPLADPGTGLMVQFVQNDHFGPLWDISLPQSFEFGTIATNSLPIGNITVPFTYHLNFTIDGGAPAEFDLSADLKYSFGLIASAGGAQLTNFTGGGTQDIGDYVVTAGWNENSSGVDAEGNGPLIADISVRKKPTGGEVPEPGVMALAAGLAIPALSLLRRRLA